MKFGKVLVFIIFFISLISISNASVCTKIFDEYVVSCKIPEHYFVQDFTCLNSECSNILKNENDGYNLDLYIDDIYIETILRDNIPLKNLRSNLNILNGICSERFDEEAIQKLSEILENYENNRWRYIGGDKLLILPNTDENKEKIITKHTENDKYLERCYNIQAQEVSNWLIPSKISRPYCEIEFDNTNDCFTTEIKYDKFLFYLILNPSLKTFGYLFTIIVIFVSLILILDTLFYVYRKKRHREFFSFTKGKIKAFLILIIPYLYLYGTIVGEIVNKRFYGTYIGISTELILVLLGIFFLYFLVCLGKYLDEKYEFKYFVLKKFGKIK